MRKARLWIPVLGTLAVAALTLKNYLECHTCASNSHPYFLFLGSGYFAGVVAASLLFPSFPGPLVARGGLNWAILLALALIYINFPHWCAACLVAHACNILIWILLLPSQKIS